MGVAAAGMIMPHRVLTSPSEETTWYTGRKITCNGIMMVASVMTNSVSRPRKLYLDKAYAAIELTTSVSTVASTVTIAEFRK